MARGGPVGRARCRFALDRGLAPLGRVAAAVQKRRPGELAPLAASGWPREVMPLVDALATLLANLVDNAIRYTPAGGRVDVLVGASPSRVSVRDDGPGVPASERERLFERFARGDGATAPGSGLGLAIVRRIAERHGASVALGEGIGGRGLAMVVTFDRSEGARAPAPPAPPGARPSS